MNRIRPRDLRGADDCRNVQVAVGAARRPDTDVLVGKPHVQGVLVGFRVDGDRLDAELAAGVDDPQRDLTPVGDQYFLEHHASRASRASTTPWFTQLTEFVFMPV